MPRKISILVVDDSAFMRRLIVEILETVPNFEVIKTVKNGFEALKAVEKYKPDVVTLDIEMPEIDGITALVYIMEKFPTPVIMVSGFSKFLGEETIKALEYGAVGFIRKPSGGISSNLTEIKKDLIKQVKIAARVDVKKLKAIKIHNPQKKSSRSIIKSTNKIVVFASSSGGPRALAQIIPELPADLKAGVVIIQHMPGDFIFSFAARLDWESQLHVKVAENGDQIQQGMVFLAPGDHHCRIVSNGKNEEIIKITPFTGNEESGLISADETMISIAPIYGKNAIGIVLTGMGMDGTKGLKEIKNNGGFTIAEHESTAIVFGMPKEAIKARVMDKVLPLDKIARFIVEKVNGYDHDFKKTHFKIKSNQN